MPVLTKEYQERKIRDKLGCSQEMIAHILGVSSQTVFRWEKRSNHPSPLAKQRLAELQKVIRKMRGVIKHGKESAWLNSPNEDLSGKTPLQEMTRGSEGVEEVLDLLGRAEWGIGI